MSDSDDKGAGVSASRSAPEPEPQPEPSLDALALAETLAERRATDETPHHRRPDELLAALSGLPDAPVVLAEALLVASDAADSNEQTQAAPDLSPGTRRAIAAIFGGGNAIAGRQDEQDEQGEPLALVAETAVAYRVNQEEGGAGLLNLARERQLDAEALAAQIMLTPAALDWLDRVALPLGRQPEALVSHLVGALGVERARVSAALAIGEALTGADDQTSLAELLARAGMLTPAQRSYWEALLPSSI